jgi:hypothetical protein
MASTKNATPAAIMTVSSISLSFARRATFARAAERRVDVCQAEKTTAGTTAIDAAGVALHPLKGARCV